MICEPVNTDAIGDVKICSKCKIAKDVSCFSVRSDRKIGLQSSCKDCQKSARAAKEPKIFLSYPETKICNKCKLDLPSIQFTKKPDSSDGLGYTCKSCEKERHERRSQAEKVERLTKVCSVCNTEKSSAMFYLHKYMTDGRSSICKECDLKDKKARSLIPKQIPETKFCKACNTNKSSLEFYIKSSAKDGLQIICKECQTSQHSQYLKDNSDIHVAQVQRRRARKKMSSPPWLSKFHHLQFSWFCSAAKMMTETTGELHHVDHIHPLSGENFSGLHVPWNLRVITAINNSLKSNKPQKEEANMFWPYTMKQLEA